LLGLGLFSPSVSGILPLMDNAQTNQQRILDNEHLKLLSIFHYVLGGIVALFACIPIVHVVIGLCFIIVPRVFGHGSNQPPAVVGWLFVILGSGLILLGWTFAALVLIAGRFIARRQGHTFCFIVACVECLWMPFGTCLGVFTILVLNRASVNELFKPRPAI